MKLDIVKICAGVIIVLILLMCPMYSGLAADTTWRHSGFTQWGYDINSHGLNIWNGTQNNAPYAYLITKNDTHIIAINGVDGSIDYTNATDLSPVLNSVINATYDKKGGDIKIVANNYNLYSTIILKSDVNLIGDGGDVGFYNKGTTFYRKWNDSDSYMVSYNTSLMNSGNIISDIRFEGNPYSGNGIHMDSTRFNIFIRNTVYKCGIGLRMTENNHPMAVSESNLIYSNRFIYNTGNAIELESYDQTVDSNIIDITQANASTAGIFVNMSSNTIIRNSIRANRTLALYGAQTGIHVAPLGGYSLISNNFLDNTGSGIITEGDYVGINDNRFYACNESPILMSGANFCTISHNLILDWGFKTPNGYSGITLTNCLNNSIMGNTFRNDSCLVHSWLRETGTTNNSVIIGNIKPAGVSITVIGGNTETVYNH